MKQPDKRSKVAKKQPSKSRRNASSQPVTSQFRNFANDLGPDGREVPKRLRDASVALAEVFLHPDTFDDEVAGELAAQWKTWGKRVRNLRSTLLSLWQLGGNAPIQREPDDKVPKPQPKRIRTIISTIKKETKKLEEGKLNSSGTPKRRQKRAK